MILGNDRIMHEMQHHIRPFDPRQVGPASYDVRLGHGIKRLTGKSPWIAAKANPIDFDTWTEDLPIVDGWYQLPPGECYLGTIMEHITLPRGVRAVLSGRSSIGRLFLTIHVTAGFIDPGFCGEITLELKNESKSSIYIQPGVRIGQLEFADVDGCSMGYGDKPDCKYQNQEGATPSKIHKDKF